MGIIRAGALLLLIAGCAPRITASNSAGGIVNSTGALNGQKRGFEAADAECRKSGKVARITSHDIMRNSMAFECVAP